MKGGIRKIEIASGETTETDNGIAMAMLLLIREFEDVKERMQTLVNTHAMRRGVSLAVD